MTKPDRFQFYSERVFARVSIAIPKRLRAHRGAVRTWTISDIIGELVRTPENSPHVDQPANPVAVYGYAPEQLHEYADQLEILERRQVETYERRGKEHTRAVRKTTPTLMVAVASWPEPTMADSAERRRWVGLVVEACRERWGRRCRSIIAHEDESHYHLHILVDNVGESVKPLHMGHQLANLEEEKKKKGEAYRVGGSLAQDWFFEKVGEPMGWERNRPDDMRAPRAPRPVALRNRQAELEDMARQLEDEREELRRAVALLRQRDEELSRSAAEFERFAGEQLAQIEEWATQARLKRQEPEDDPYDVSVF